MAAATAAAGEIEVGFAKLQGEEFEYYMQTYSIVLGRSSKHGDVDVDLGSLGGGMNISRIHARIFYDFARRRFALEVIGKNGCYVEGVSHTPGNAPVKLDSQDLLQMGDLKFYFLLPTRSVFAGGVIPRRPLPVGAGGRKAARPRPPDSDEESDDEDDEDQEEDEEEEDQEEEEEEEVGGAGNRAEVFARRYGKGREEEEEEEGEEEEIGGAGKRVEVFARRYGKRGKVVVEEEEEEEEEVGKTGKRVEVFARKYGKGGKVGPSSSAGKLSGKKLEARSRANREADNLQLMQLEEKDVVACVTTVLSDLCGPGDWMPMPKLHAQLVEQYGNVWHHSRVRRYLTSEDRPQSETKGKPWFGLLTLLRKHPEHFVINTRSKGRATSEFVSLVSLVS